MFCADKDVAGNIDRLEKLMIKNGMDAAGAKQYADMMRSFEKGMDDQKKLAWAQRQVYLALGNALNGSKALGIDSCPMEGFDSAAYAKILDLPANIVPTVLCPIGYAADTSKPKVRFDENEVFI